MKSLQQLKSLCWPSAAATTPVHSNNLKSKNNHTTSHRPPHHHHNNHVNKKHGMNIIFLDIDGVLLPFDTDVGPPFVFPEKNLQALSTIFDAMPNTVVVLSSTWRVAPCFYNQVLQAFAQYSATHGGPLASITTFLDMTDPNYHDNRQWEIYRWLQQYQRRNPTLRIKSWVAIDDVDLLEGEKNSLYRPHFEGKVVKTDSHLGLTTEDAEMAVQILKQQQTQTRGVRSLLQSSQQRPSVSELKLG